MFDRSGTLSGSSFNVPSVSKTRAGEVTIVWAQECANADDHTSVTPTDGRYEIANRTVGSLSLRTFDYEGNRKSIELDVFAIGGT